MASARTGAAASARTEAESASAGTEAEEPPPRTGPAAVPAAVLAARSRSLAATTRSCAALRRCSSRARHSRGPAASASRLRAPSWPQVQPGSHHTPNTTWSLSCERPGQRSAGGTGISVYAHRHFALRHTLEDRMSAPQTDVLRRGIH
eukprot:scaffold119813_cov57-Phaeocystis_antarctica.AAC.2